MKRTVFLHVSLAKDVSLDSISDGTKNRFETVTNELTFLKELILEAYQELIDYDLSDETLNEINEATKERVLNSSTISMVILIILGLWEIWYVFDFASILIS